MLQAAWGYIWFIPLSNNYEDNAGECSDDSSAKENLSEILQALESFSDGISRKHSTDIRVSLHGGTDPLLRLGSLSIAEALKKLRLAHKNCK